MVVVFVMDRELAQLLALKFASAVRTDPWKHLERLLSIGLLQLNLGALCHARLREDGDSLLRDYTTIKPPKRREMVSDACGTTGASC